VKQFTFTRLASLLLFVVCAGSTQAAIVNFSIQIQNIGPAGGVALTPVWVGFHSGNFDIYDSGAAAPSFLENLAEDGATAAITTAFGSGAGRVQATLATAAPGPLLPGQTVSQTFALQDDGSNRFFSYASMVIPSNDLFVANANPNAFDLSTLAVGGAPLTITVGAPGTVNDAGTELDSGAGGFNTSAANGLFGLPGGQTSPNQGPLDSSNLVRTVTGDPFANFGTAVPGALNFNNAAVYTGGGIARITITAVPEPSSAMLLTLGLTALTGLRRRRG
jgi:hypothetical protein